MVCRLHLLSLLPRQIQATRLSFRRWSLPGWLVVSKQMNSFLPHTKVRSISQTNMERCLDSCGHRAWLALMDGGDAYHVRSREFFRQNREPLMTTYPVLVECVHLMFSRLV